MVLTESSSALPVGILSNEAGPSQESLSKFRRITIDLPLNSTKNEGSGSVLIHHGTDSDALTLTLVRTIRVPDNQDTNLVPPGLGHFPLFKVQDYADKMPSEMAAKGGLFFPMYQREALEINFSALRPFALKVYVGGVNAVSGLPMRENEQTRQKRLKMLKDGKQIQDYMVVPGQTWLDGIMSEDGKFRQFIAKPKGSGFSVEAQATGEEKMGGMQIEIIPVKFEVPKKLDVRYKNMQEQSFKWTLALAEKGLGEQSTLFDLKNLLRDEFEVAVKDQVLDADTSGLNIFNNLNASEADAKSIKLGSLYFKPNLTLKLSHIKPQFGNLFQYGYDAARAASSAVLMGLEQGKGHPSIR
ncbi:integral membrane protein [Seiridium cupressi]